MHRPTMRTLLLAALIASASRVGAQQADRPVPLYDNLGTHQYTISTSVPTAQQYFDQGLRLYFAFNHAESIRAFAEATRLDSLCAICHWGVALGRGPNINLPMDSANGAAAYVAVQQAVGLREHAAPTERALIDALATRYEAVPRAERAALDSAYARAMKDVVRRFPADLEARALYAESLMDLSPWNYWTRDGGQPRPDTREMVAELEHVLAHNPDHPGANHFFIHAVEAVDPARAVPMAERLAGLMPGAGHLVHMPGHIYIRVGRYDDAIAANEHAVHADERFIRDQNPGLGVYTAGYYPHNYDFLAFAASMVGRSAQAIGAAEQMTTLVPAEMMSVPGMTLQHHRTRHLQLKVRFAQWNDILATPAPDAALPHARGMWHYAHGRALVATGKPELAEADLTQLRLIAADPAVAPLRLDFNTSGTVLQVAAAVLAGRIAEARGDHDTAISQLREAARLEDAMTYGEPPEWTIPVRHDLGDVLLAADRPADAEATYRKDLKRFPENGWSLRGLALSLTAQGKQTEAADVRRRFEAVWRGADVKLSAHQF